MAMGKTKLDRIAERFPGKQINRLMSFRNGCTLNWSERVVLSFLFYRCRREGKLTYATITKVSRLSGMHRDTISKALRTLEANLLVRLQGKKWGLMKAGFDKHPDWFGWRNRGREIRDIAYHYFPHPAINSPLSIIDSLIYLADIFDPGKSAACLAARFGISWNTVKKSRRKVAALEYTPDWFMDIEFATQPLRPTDKATFLKQFDGAEKHLVARMLANINPWPQDDIQRFLKLAKEKYPTPDGYDNLLYTLVGDGSRSFDAIMQDHRQSGNGQGNGMGLLLYRLGFLKPTNEVAADET